MFLLAGCTQEVYTLQTGCLLPLLSTMLSGQPLLLFLNSPSSFLLLTTFLTIDGKTEMYRTLARGPMGGAPYIGPKLGGGPIFEVSVSRLYSKERPGKLPR